MIKKVFPVLAFSTFSSMLGEGIIAPMLPFYARDLGATITLIGVMFAGYSVSRAIVMPVAGRLSDRRGRKLFICIGLLVYAILSMGYAWVGSIGQLILIRFIHGGASGLVIPVGQAYIGDISPEGEEGKWMGFYNVAFFTGFGIGPLMGGVLADHFGIDIAFYTMGGLNMLAFLGSVIFLPEVRGRKKATNPGLSLREIAANRMVKGLFSFRLTSSLGMGAIFAFLPIFTIDYMGLNTTLTGLLLAVNILLMSFLQVYAGKMADRFNRRSLVVIGGLLNLVFLAFIPQSQGFWQLLGLVVLGGVGGAVAMPAASALMIEEGRRFGMGSTISVVFIGMSLGMVFGSILGGVITDTLGIGATFYFAAGAGIVGTILFWHFTGGSALARYSQSG